MLCELYISEFAMLGNNMINSAKNFGVARVISDCGSTTLFYQQLYITNLQ